MTEDIQPEQHHKTLEISNASVMQANNKGRNNERDQACERGTRSRPHQTGRCQPESHAADGQDPRKALQADVFLRGASTKITQSGLEQNNKQNVIN